MVLYFSGAKNLGEIPTGHPILVGLVQTDDFRITSRYISEAVQDRDTVTTNH